MLHRWKTSAIRYCLIMVKNHYPFDQLSYHDNRSFEVRIYNIIKSKLIIIQTNQVVVINIFSGMSIWPTKQLYFSASTQQVSYLLLHYPLPYSQQPHFQPWPRLNREWESSLASI